MSCYGLSFSILCPLRGEICYEDDSAIRRIMRDGAERRMLMRNDRLYQSTHAACEELRTMDSPSMKDAGRLYRLAMEKKEIYGHEGVPIEYARAQTDTPARVGWNHEWTRS